MNIKIHCNSCMYSIFVASEYFKLQVTRDDWSSSKQSGFYGILDL